MPFEGFSEAAQLYAENLGVIEALKKEMDSDARSFLQAIEEEVQPHVNNRLQSSEYRGYYYWWLGVDGAHKNDYPQLYFNLTRFPELVVPGKLVVVCCAPGKEKAVLVEITKVVDDVAGCRSRNGAEWSIFEAELSYGAEPDITAIASYVAELLLAIERRVQHLTG
ncbi:MAG: hypothetical protein KDB14_34670 [Planctomycetales bacterium]|nr:hypothetical protein [Planctomycetales bacterium]